jgi:hypothetical protein
MPRWARLAALSLLLAPPVGAAAVERIVVLPLESVARSPSGRAVVMEALEADLAAKGYEVVVGTSVEDFLRANRIRYLDSIPTPQVDQMLEAYGAEAVLTGSLLAYDTRRRDAEVAIALRMVGRGGALRWSSMAGLSAADTVEAFGRGRVDRVEDLARRVVAQALETLPPESIPRAYGRPGGSFASAGRVFRAKELTGRELVIAVLPLQNRTRERPVTRALEAILLQRLGERPGIRVVHPAELRQAVAANRLRAPARLAADQLRVLGKSVGTTLFLQGTVFHYGQTSTEIGETPFVEIYLSLYDVESGHTVWSGIHRRTGLDYEGWMRFGAVHDLTSLGSRTVAELVYAFTRD